jgi:ribonuclease P protein component
MAESLARTEILRRRRDVSRVRRFGAKTSTRFLSLRCTPNPDSPTDNPAVSGLLTRRVAFLLPRGVGNAVERNRLKRRLREIYRRNKDWFPAGQDCIIQPTVAAGRLSFDELKEQVRSATVRVGQNPETRIQNCGPGRSEPRINTDEHGCRRPEPENPGTLEPQS